MALQEGRSPKLLMAAFMNSNTCKSAPNSQVIAGSRFPYCALLAILLFVSVLSALSTADAAAPPYQAGEVLVKFRHEATVLGVQQVIAARPGSHPVTDKIRQVSIRPGETVEQVIIELEALPEVEYAEPNYIRQLQEISPPNDPFFGEQWSLDNTGQQLQVPQSFPGTPDSDISALDAWEHTTGSDAIVVAVIDSGIDFSHPDLAGNLWNGPGGVIGKDFLDGDNTPRDSGGHGTRIAGIIGARGNNGIGVAGVAWDVSLMALRVFDANGQGTVSNIVAAINFAIENKARVINASFGASRFSEIEYEAFQAATDAGILVVTAAGNEGANNDGNSGQNASFYPASYELPTIISVAATDNSDALIPSSNYGAQSVDIGAPGQDILTIGPVADGQVNNSLAYADGTSASAAFVSGAAALLLSQNPALSASQLRDILLNSADPAPNLTGRTVSGGRLNIAAALISEANLTGSSIPTPPTVTTGGGGAIIWAEWLFLLTNLMIGYRLSKIRQI